MSGGRLMTSGQAVAGDLAGDLLLVAVARLVDPVDRGAGVLGLEVLDQRREVRRELVALQRPGLEGDRALDRRRWCRPSCWPPPALPPPVRMPQPATTASAEITPRRVDRVERLRIMMLLRVAGEATAARPRPSSHDLRCDQLDRFSGRNYRGSGIGVSRVDANARGAAWSACRCRGAGERGGEDGTTDDRRHRGKRAGVSKGAASFALNGQAGRQRGDPGADPADRQADELAPAQRGAGAERRAGRPGRPGVRATGPHARRRAVLRADRLRAAGRTVGPLDRAAAADRRGHRGRGRGLPALALGEPRRGRRAGRPPRATTRGSPSSNGSGCPASSLGGAGPHGSLPSVWADDRAAMLRIVEYLAALGHRRIAHVAGLPELPAHPAAHPGAARRLGQRLGLVDATSITTDFSRCREGAAATGGCSRGRPPRPRSSTTAT